MIAIVGCSDPAEDIESGEEHVTASYISEDPPEHDDNGADSEIISPTVSVPGPDDEPDNEPDTSGANNAQAGSLAWGEFPFSFTVEDIFGNTFSEETLGEKQLFFVHLWATWCPPCIVELPDMAIVSKEFSDRVGFIGLLDDFDSNPDGAFSLIDSADKPDSFITLDARLPEVAELLSLLQTGYVPTTVIFTADGIMFEPIIGARGLVYGDILESILEG